MLRSVAEKDVKNAFSKPLILGFYDIEKRWNDIIYGNMWHEYDMPKTKLPLKLKPARNGPKWHVHRTTANPNYLIVGVSVHPPIHRIANFETNWSRFLSRRRSRKNSIRWQMTKFREILPSFFLNVTFLKVPFGWYLFRIHRVFSAFQHSKIQNVWMVLKNHCYTRQMNTYLSWPLPQLLD